MLKFTLNYLQLYFTVVCPQIFSCGKLKNPISIPEQNLLERIPQVAT